MTHLTFEWDAAKNDKNIIKHKISFAEAKTVFSDEYGRLIADPDHSDEKDRYILLRASIDSRLLIGNYSAHVRITS